MRIFVVVVVVACSNSKPAPPAAKGSAQPALPPLAAGPVPVTLPALAPAQLRTLTSASNGFLTIDAKGEVRWGLAPKAGYAGELLQRDDPAFGQLFPYPEDRGHEHHSIRAESVVEPDRDAFAVLTDAPTTEVLLLVDAATPARITLRRGLGSLGTHASALAAGAANTAIKYRFGGDEWVNMAGEKDLIVHVGHLDVLADQHPASVVLEFTDDTTTGDLVNALGTLAAAGVHDVRIHKMMGWGAIAPAEVLDLETATADDDLIRTVYETLEVADPTVTGGVTQAGVASALAASKSRFRYCYEMRGVDTLRGTVKLAFDVGADGAISHAKASGVDAKVADCIARSVFDLDITPLAITAAGHADVAITFTPSETAAAAAAPPPPPEGGYWCWIDGDVSQCAPLEDECNVGRDAYTRTGASFGEAAHPTECTHQKTAWTSNGKAFNATRALCGKGCRQVH